MWMKEIQYPSHQVEKIGNIRRKEMSWSWCHLSCIFRKGHYHGVTLPVSIADNNIFSKMILLSYLLRHSLLALLYQHWNPPAWVRVMLMLTLQMWKWRFSSILFSYKISCFQIHIANFLTWKGINVMYSPLYSLGDLYFSLSISTFQHHQYIPADSLDWVNCPGPEY